jgi:hypothetical protein
MQARLSKYPQIMLGLREREGGARWDQVKNAEWDWMWRQVKDILRYTPLKLNDQNVEDDMTISQEDLNTWKTKTLHGKFPNSVQEYHVDKESSLLWLSADSIYPEMEGFAVAIHNCGIKPRNYEKHSLEV